VRGAMDTIMVHKGLGHNVRAGLLPEVLFFPICSLMLRFKRKGLTGTFQATSSGSPVAPLLVSSVASVGDYTKPDISYATDIWINKS
jgi:hypothetical protein